MSKISTLFFFLVFLLACGDNQDTKKAGNDDNLSIEPAPEIIAPALLDKANLELSDISQEDFEAIPYPDADFRKSRQLCEQSKGYKANQWEGLNECCWAEEKEKINAFKEVVRRKDKQLFLKTSSGEISLQHSPEAKEGATYFRFKDFISTSNYYLIEEIINGQCLNSRMISGVDGQAFNFKGMLTPFPDGIHFIVYYLNPSGAANCSNKLEYYEIGAEGILKKWHIPFQNHRVHDLKPGGDREVYLALSINEETTQEIDYTKVTIGKDPE